MGSWGVWFPTGPELSTAPGQAPPHSPRVEMDQGTRIHVTPAAAQCLRCSARDHSRGESDSPMKGQSVTSLSQTQGHSAVALAALAQISAAWLRIKLQSLQVMAPCCNRRGHTPGRNEACVSAPPLPLLKQLPRPAHGAGGKGQSPAPPTGCTPTLPRPCQGGEKKNSLWLQEAADVRQGSAHGDLGPCVNKVLLEHGYVHSLPAADRHFCFYKQW